MVGKVFVTGAAGFIGSHVVEELVNRGYAVTALVEYNSMGSIGWLGSLRRETLDHVEVFHGDVRDGDLMTSLMRGHDFVAHLASLIAIPYSYLAPASYLETNTLGTLNVLNAARSANVSRFVHTSTSEVYGSARYVPIDERHPLAGQSPYSASKIAADQFAFSFWSSFDLPVVTLRPFNAYGPRQSQRAFIPSVSVQLLSGRRELELGSLTPTRDLTYVTDTACGFVDVLGSDLGLGQTFNMGSGFEVSMGDVLHMLCEIAGHQPEIVEVSSRVRPSQSEVQRLLSDSSRMTETFGWRPKLAGDGGLRAGLEATYTWLKDNHTGAGYDAARYVV